MGRGLSAVSCYVPQNKSPRYFTSVIAAGAGFVCHIGVGFELELDFYFSFRLLVRFALTVATHQLKTQIWAQVKPYLVTLPS